MKNVLAKLVKIQNELVAPKGQTNTFGKYKYRSAEDILNALKGLLKDTKTVIRLSDELVLIGDRYYIKATATLYDSESEEHISNTAYAREEESKKGMDGSQITGTASSYARKYALNGLLAIDDTKDADTDEHTKITRKETKASVSQINMIKRLLEGKVNEQYTIEHLTNGALARLKVKKFEDLTAKQASDFIAQLQK